MKLPNIAKAAGLSTALIVLSAGAGLAAIATNPVNVRTGPSIDFRAIDVLRPGEQVAIVDRDGGWCAVQKSGPDGWVSCRYLSDSIRFRDLRDGPSVSLSFGIGARPDRPPRHNDDWWWDDDHHDHDGDWDRDRRRDGGMFSLSLSN